MKKFVCCFLLGCFVMILSSCGDGGVRAPLSDRDFAMEAYTKVLKNEAEFFSTALDENVYLIDYYQEMFVESNFADDELLAWLNLDFAVVDLDGDGIPEVVTNALGPYVGEIYHYEDGMVYGFLYGIREMSALKKDGSFKWSGGMEYNGYGRLKYSGKECEIINLAVYDLNISSGEETYQIGEVTVKEEEYEAFRAEQEKKANVDWHKLNDENMSTYLR